MMGEKSKAKPHCGKVVGISRRCGEESTLVHVEVGKDASIAIKLIETDMRDGSPIAIGMKDLLRWAEATAYLTQVGDIDEIPLAITKSAH